MPHTRLPLRRSLAVLSAALLAAAWAVGISVPASAAPVKGSLDIVSVTDTVSGLGGPVQDRPFNVTVRVLDNAGQPTTVNQATTIVLEEVSGPGDLAGNRLRSFHAMALAQPSRVRRTPVRERGCAAGPRGIRSAARPDE